MSDQSTAIEAIPGKTRIGWIGTGVMGASMCSHLQKAGFSTTVFNRTRSKAQALLDAGATWADSPQAVAEQSDIVFAIVGFPKDVRETFLCPERGVLAAKSLPHTIVDMTTSEPTLAVEIHDAASKLGVHALDAPVSGGDLGAREGKLSIMIGGSSEVVSALQPCWEALGQRIVHQGPAGSGQHTKMVNQTLISTMMIGVCEALIYGYRAGLNLETVLQSVGSGAAGSWSLTNLGPRIIANDFDPGFFVDHFVKDMGIALAESRRMGLSMPGLAMAEQLYRSVQAKGHGLDGTQALMKTLAELSGIDWENRK